MICYRSKRTLMESVKDNREKVGSGRERLQILRQIWHLWGGRAGVVLVYSGYHSKIPQIWWLKWKKIYYYYFFSHNSGDYKFKIKVLVGFASSEVPLPGLQMFTLLLWASQVVLMVKNSPASVGDIRGFDSCVEKIPWRRARQPTPVFFPGESSWTEEPGGLQSMGLQKSWTQLSD